MDANNIKEKFPIEEVARRLGIKKGKGSNSNWHCPIHGDDKKPSLKITSGKNLFYCHTCGFGGDTITLVEWVNSFSFKEACEWITGDSSLFKGQAKDKRLSKGKYKRETYFEDHLISKKSQEKYGLHLGSYKGRLSAVIPNVGGKHHRMFGKDAEKNKFLTEGEAVLFETKGKDTNSAYLFEGELKAILFTQMTGTKAFSGTGGANTFKPEWKSRFDDYENIFYYPDNDEPGLEGVHKVADIVGESKLFVGLIPENFNDFTDYVAAGGKPSNVNFTPYIEFAGNLSSKQIILPKDDDLFGKLESGAVEQILTGMKWFDASTGGLYRDGFYPIVGMSKSGKTTYLMNWVNNLVSKKVKVGVLDTELGVRRFRLRMAALWHCVEKAEIEKHSEKYLSEWSEEVKPFLFYRTSKSLTDENGVLNPDYLAAICDEWKSKGCEVVFIDNLTKMNTPTTAGDTKGWANLARSMNYLIDFARENEIAVVAAVHAKGQSVQILEGKKFAGKVKKAIEENAPESLFSQTANAFPRPQADQIYGGGVKNLVSGGMILVWRPFADYGKDSLSKHGLIILEQFREGASITEIPCEFDMPASRVYEINPNQLVSISSENNNSQGQVDKFVQQLELEKEAEK